MEAINKLRAMQRWYDMQSEYMNFAFKSLKGMEKAFDYSIEHDLEFIDDDYLFSDNFTESERVKHIKSILKFQSFRPHLVWIFPVIVGYSRIYLGVHYPGDVFVGMIVGASWGLILAQLFKARALGSKPR